MYIALYFVFCTATVLLSCVYVLWEIKQPRRSWDKRFRGLQGDAWLVFEVFFLLPLPGATVSADTTWLFNVKWEGCRDREPIKCISNPIETVMMMDSVGSIPRPFALAIFLAYAVNSTSSFALCRISFLALLRTAESSEVRNRL